MSFSIPFKSLLWGFPLLSGGGLSPPRRSSPGEAGGLAASAFGDSDDDDRSEPATAGEESGDRVVLGAMGWKAEPEDGGDVDPVRRGDVGAVGYGENRCWPPPAPAPPRSRSATDAIELRLAA